eukprot:UN05757
MKMICGGLRHFAFLLFYVNAYFALYHDPKILMPQFLQHKKCCKIGFFYFFEQFTRYSFHPFATKSSMIAQLFLHLPSEVLH